jgi:hypothetical protein
VFVALVIGLLLGVAIGDQGLVSGAERDLREDLRADVRSARSASRDLQAELQRRQRYEEATYPGIVADRLSGRRVAVVALGQPSSATLDAVRDAIEPAGGEVAFIGRLRVPLDRDGLAEAVAGTRFALLGDDDDLIEPFARRVGEQLVAGGRLARDLRQRLFASSSGALDGAEAVVVLRSGATGTEAGEDADELDDRYVRALLDGLESFETPVAGVERTDTEPSTVDWFRDRGISSIDNVEQPAGQTSLVLVLAGGGAGAYGVKPSAEALLPEALVQQP